MNGTNLISINLLLDHQLPPTSWNESLKHFLKVSRNLLKSPLDSFVFSLIKGFNQLFDTRRRTIQLFSTFQQFITLSREIVVLLKGFLVDMSEFL